MATLFISDLHLDPARPHISQLFVGFLRANAGKIDALYILGDLFEAWIGDDFAAPAQPIIDALRAFSATGTPLYIMHGNRDFLLGQAFAEATGATLINEPTVIELYDTPTLLLHGDVLCTDDTNYQQFRTMVRNPQWQQAFLAKPIPERIALAQQARGESREQTQAKAAYIMDANPTAVVAALREHNVLHMIHGHTHRPMVHDVTLDGAMAKRYVLGDWYDQGSVLSVSPREWILSNIPMG